MHFQLVLHLYLNWFYPFIKSGILSHVYSTDVFPCLQCTRHQTYWPSSLDSPELHCTCILVAFDRNRWKLFIMKIKLWQYCDDKVIQLLIGQAWAMLPFFYWRESNTVITLTSHIVLNGRFWSAKLDEKFVHF